MILVFNISNALGSANRCFPSGNCSAPVTVSSTLLTYRLLYMETCRLAYAKHLLVGVGCSLWLRGVLHAFTRARKPGRLEVTLAYVSQNVSGKHVFKGTYSYINIDNK